MVRRERTTDIQSPRLCKNSPSVPVEAGVDILLPLFIRLVAFPICLGGGTVGDSDRLSAIAILKSSSS